MCVCEEKARFAETKHRNHIVQSSEVTETTVKRRQIIGEDTTSKAGTLTCMLMGPNLPDWFNL